MSNKTILISGILILTSFICLGQANKIIRIQYFSEKDPADSLACAIRITDKAEHTTLKKRAFSHLIDVSQCVKIECIPPETTIFYELEEDCLQVSGALLIKIKSEENYNYYKSSRTLIKQNEKGKDELSMTQSKHVGINDATSEKSIFFQINN